MQFLQGPQRSVERAEERRGAQQTRQGGGSTHLSRSPPAPHRSRCPEFHTQGGAGRAAPCCQCTCPAACALAPGLAAPAAENRRRYKCISAAVSCDGQMRQSCTIVQQRQQNGTRVGPPRWATTWQHLTWSISDSKQPAVGRNPRLENWPDQTAFAPESVVHRTMWRVLPLPHPLPARRQQRQQSSAAALPLPSAAARHAPPRHATISGRGLQSLEQASASWARLAQRCSVEQAGGLPPGADEPRHVA